jgi:hypothetical protein
MIKYHCFLSYTNRDKELQELKPLLDCLGGIFRSLGVIRAPFFWDRFHIDTPSDSEELARSLLAAVRESACMLALVSPSYLSSPWCIFEWGAMAGVSLDRAHRVSLISYACRSASAPRSLGSWWTAGIVAFPTRTGITRLLRARALATSVRVRSPGSSSRRCPLGVVIVNHCGPITTNVTSVLSSRCSMALT